MTEWAPVFGSGLIALVTLIVLIVTVGQNQRALADAHERAYGEWERDTITANTAKAVEAAGRVVHELRTTLTQRGVNDEYLKRLKNDISVMYSAAAVLELFPANNVAVKCRRLAITAQQATAHMLLNWHQAKGEFSYVPGGDIPKAMEEIFEWAAKVERASRAMCKQFLLSVASAAPPNESKRKRLKRLRVAKGGGLEPPPPHY